MSTISPILYTIIVNKLPPNSKVKSHSGLLNVVEHWFYSESDCEFIASYAGRLYKYNIHIYSDIRGVQVKITNINEILFKEPEKSKIE